MGKIVKTLAMVIAIIFVITGFSYVSGIARATVSQQKATRINPTALRNLTVDPTLVDSGNSAVVASPPVRVPDTTPVVLRVLSDGPVKVPSGQWGAIVMNYTGASLGTVFDTYITTTVNGVQIYEGVQPEYGNWTVFVNVTQYSALFHGTVTIGGTRAIGYTADFLGHIWTNITFLFYPAAAGEALSPVPNIIEPLFNLNYIGSSGGSLSAKITVPNDTRAAVLELWPQGNAVDEFWYGAEPVYRTVQVNVDGTPVASVLPFPNINSGGVDLFLWRPILPVFEINHPPNRVNLTGALGLMDGAHTLSIKMPIVGAGGFWLISGDLLLYTSHNVVSAKLTSHTFYQSPVHTIAKTSNVQNANGNYYTVFDQQAITHFSYSSNIKTLNGSISVSSYTKEYSSFDQTLNPVWVNLSGVETTVSHQTVTYAERGTSGTQTTNEFVSFPVAMDTGFEFTVTSTTNGGFPMYGPFSSLTYNLSQSWIQSTSETNVINGGHSTVLTSFSDTVLGNNGIFSGIIELLSPTGGFIKALTYTSAFTTKIYTQHSYASTTQQPFISEEYFHLIKGSEINAPQPNIAETVTTNIQQYEVMESPQ